MPATPAPTTRTSTRSAPDSSLRGALTVAGSVVVMLRPPLARVMQATDATQRGAERVVGRRARGLDLGEWVEPTKQWLDAYLAGWVAGQRLSASTISSYRKNIRLHIDPYLGETTLARLTGGAVDTWMRTLEASGRADGRGGLSARTVRYVYTILRSALSDAVRNGRLSVNPTDRSTPPSPSEARPPEMQAWTAGELARFLRWAEDRDPDLAMGWRLLAATGMRRGEALALRWRDVDLDAGRLQGRRSVGTVKTNGADEELVEGPTKTGQARVVDIDSDTVAVLRAYRANRGLLAPELVR